MQKSDPNYYCWVVAYIDSQYLDRVEKDLKRYPVYQEVEAYIPTVKVLKKQFKGKDHFEEVPLLFNYGFFKIPRKFAIYQTYLENMKQNISCIYAWVKDPLKIISARPSGEIRDTQIPIATATEEEITELLKQSFAVSIHDASEVESLHPGQTITLRGYPFDGMMAVVKEIYPHKQKIKVSLEMMNHMRDVEVSFDNVFFTVYHSNAYDDSLTIKHSLDAMAENHTLNKKVYKNAKTED